MKLTNYQRNEVERLRRRFPSASEETLRYHVMTETQRACYWIDQTLTTVFVFGSIIALIVLCFTFA
jgi:hypothetical protein